MNSKQLSALVFGLAWLVSLGCGSHPIPRAAVAGTTISIALPNFFGAGFGTAMNSQLTFGSGPPVDVAYTPGAVSEDEQRGEMLFALHSENDPGSGFVTYLPVSRILRVHMDEASAAANPAPDDTLPVLWGTTYKHGQVVAFLKIPEQLGAGAAPANYWIFPERWRREKDYPGPGQYHFVQQQPTINDPPEPWLGWAGATAADGIPIWIVPADIAGTQGSDRFTPEKGWDKYFGNYGRGPVWDDLNVMLPRPKVKFWVQGDVPPAAWETRIKYPRNKIEILGVELGRRNRSVALVGWEPDAPLYPTCAGEGQGSFRVFMVDPEQTTPWIRIIYRVRPLDDPDCQGRVVAGDFTVDYPTLKAYNADGGGHSVWAAFDLTNH